METIMLNVTPKYVCTIREHHKFFIRASKGVLQIVELLNNPDTLIHCSILHCDRLNNVYRLSVDKHYVANEIENFRMIENAGCSENFFYDSRYVREMKKELIYLNEQLVISINRKNIDKIVFLRDEIEFINQELGQVIVPLKKRQKNKFREFDGMFTKAQKSVWMSIMRGISEFREEDSFLGDYLNKQINIGLYSCYSSSSNIIFEIRSNPVNER